MPPNNKNTTTQRATDGWMALDRNLTVELNATEGGIPMFDSTGAFLGLLKSQTFYNPVGSELWNTRLAEIRERRLSSDYAWTDSVLHTIGRAVEYLTGLSDELERISNAERRAEFQNFMLTFSVDLQEQIWDTPYAANFDRAQTGTFEKIQIIESFTNMTPRREIRIQLSSRRLPDF